MKTDASVATDLYEWYADLPKGSHKWSVTKRSCFKKLKAAAGARKGCWRFSPPPLLGDKVLARALSRKLSQEQQSSSLVRPAFLKNCVKVRAALGANGGDMVMINLDQTPSFYD